MSVSPWMGPFLVGFLDTFCPGIDPSIKGKPASEFTYSCGRSLSFPFYISFLRRSICLLFYSVSSNQPDENNCHWNIYTVNTMLQNKQHPPESGKDVLSWLSGATGSRPPTSPHLWLINPYSPSPHLPNSWPGDAYLSWHAFLPKPGNLPVANPSIWSKHNEAWSCPSQELRCVRGWWAFHLLTPRGPCASLGSYSIYFRCSYFSSVIFTPYVHREIASLWESLVKQRRKETFHLSSKEKRRAISYSKRLTGIL